MVQRLNQAVLDRLLALLENPAAAERRVDHIRDIAGDSMRWEVSQQIRVPVLDGEAPSGEEHVLVSLGFFDKKRHPDLTVRDGAGTRLPILDRNSRAQVLSELFLPALLTRLFSVADQRALTDHFEALIRDTDTAASKRVVDFREDAERRGRQQLAELLADDEVNEWLEMFAENNHLLVWVKAVPGERVIVHYEYTETLPYPTLHRAWTDGGRLGPSRFWYLWRWLLMELGLLAVPLRLRLNGANHAQSYFFLVDPPKGTEVEAAYWHEISVRLREDSHGNRVPVDTWRLAHDSASATLACRHDERDAHLRGASIDIRIRREQLLLPFLIVSVLATACWIGRTEADGFERVLPILTVVPGALLGILAERLSDLGRRMTRTLQAHFVVVSVLAVAYGAATISDFIDNSDGPSWLNDRFLNGLLTFASVWLLGLLAYPTFARGSFRPKTINPVYTQFADVRLFRRSRRASSVLVVLASLILAIYFALDDVDRRVNEWITDTFGFGPRWFWETLDHASSGQTMTFIVGLATVGVFVLSALTGRRGGRVRATVVLGGMVALVAAVLALKGIVARDRPPGPTLLPEDGNAMPSGHAAFAVFASLAIYRNAADWLSERVHRAALVALLVAYCALVYVERLISNAHYLSDVVVGGFVGAVSYLVAARAARIRYSKEVGFHAKLG